MIYISMVYPLLPNENLAILNFSSSSKPFKSNPKGCQLCLWNLSTFMFLVSCSLSLDCIFPTDLPTPVWLNCLHWIPALHWGHSNLHKNTRWLIHSFGDSSLFSYQTWILFSFLIFFNKEYWFLTSSPSWPPMTLSVPPFIFSWTTFNLPNIKLALSPTPLCAD